MEYMNVLDTAKKWGISPRSVRNYCANGRVEGAILKGKTWYIPVGATRPTRINARVETKRTLLKVLKEEKEMGIKGGIYHKIQIDLTYSSNHIEGSTLSHEQTRYIYETNTIGGEGALNVNDIVETVNHFRAIDLVIDRANDTLSETLIKQLHFILKSVTKDARKSWFKVGEYKKLPNQVGGKFTTQPERVEFEIKNLLVNYNGIECKTLEDIVDFHHSFERIHPFQDGNGRIGRLIMFKECLKNNIVPFIIDESLKFYYYRGLSEWENTRGYLMDTCLLAQDKFKAILSYFLEE